MVYCEGLCVCFLTDVHAARWVCHYCLILGKPEIWRDTMAAFMVHVPETSPLYPHLLSL